MTLMAKLAELVRRPEPDEAETKATKVARVAALQRALGQANRTGNITEAARLSEELERLL